MTKNKLIKSSKEKSLNGVCGGIGEFFGISPFFIRLIFIFMIPVSLFIYIILSNTMSDSPRSL